MDKLWCTEVAFMQDVKELSAHIILDFADPMLT